MLLPKNSRRKLTLDHKIKLKKQLSKALKKTGLASEQTYDAPERRVHEEHRPNPSMHVMKERKELMEKQRQVEEERDREIAEKKQQKEQSVARRREANKKLGAKTRKGQPNLNNQIEALLGKITKNH